jgi:rhomboid-like protein
MMSEAGLFSGLVSHVVSTKWKYPQMIKLFAVPTQSAAKPETWAGAIAASSAKPVAEAAAKQAAPTILPSLGASGAVYACVTMTALAFPDSEIALFIPPSYPINIQYGVGALLAFDTIGILRGWRYALFCILRLTM